MEAGLANGSVTNTGPVRCLAARDHSHGAELKNLEAQCRNTDYDEGMVRRLIERITVHDDRYVVEFKSGIEIDVRL